MKWTKALASAVAIVIVAAATFAGWQVFYPQSQPERLTGAPKPVQRLQVTAVGDSLTHGVGDATNSGGYVALIQSDLTASGNYKVTTSNYGVTGDTSSQIQKRVDKQKKLQADLQKANIITVTVGGNDLMHVLQNHFFDMTTKDVTKGNAGFQKRLAKLLKTIRFFNPTAPIYVFGIYNPFYVYFPTLTAMTDAVKSWNAGTQKTMAVVPRAYYVDIDSVLTKGGNQTKSKKTESSLKKAMGSSSDSNPLIFNQDHFHPNNAGYGQMTKQLWTKMQATKKDWEK